jgi:hypothetical protein
MHRNYVHVDKYAHVQYAVDTAIGAMTASFGILNDGFPYFSLERARRRRAHQQKPIALTFRGTDAHHFTGSDKQHVRH